MQWRYYSLHCLAGNICAKLVQSVCASSIMMVGSMRASLPALVSLALLQHLDSLLRACHAWPIWAQPMHKCNKTVANVMTLLPHAPL